MTGFLEIALSAHAAGLCVVPPRMDGSKAPFSRTWKAFQQARPDPDQLRRWYSDGLTGIGAIPGAVSGNLEVLEFDEGETYFHFKDVADEAGLGPIIARLEHGYVESSPSGGRHWLYRCAEIGGNTKLATRPDGRDDHGRPLIKTLIETRGEGGFIILAPSCGRVHPSGRPYKLLGGGFSTIPTLAPEERRELFALARTFHIPDPAKIRDSDPRPAGAATGERPGDAFNARARWSDVLEPHGWMPLYERGGTHYWRRPGKGKGVSAATNWQGRDYLFVWSSSTPFETETPITKFAAYAVLEHGGDLKAAAKALAGQGYGEPAKTPKPEQPANSEDRNDGVGWLASNRICVLKVRPGQLPELADEAEKILAAHDGNIFQRSGYLARVATTRAETVQGIKRPAGNTIIVPIDLDFLLDRLSRQIGFIKYSDRKEDWVPCNAPRPLASTLLSRSGLWNFPPLVSVITAPTLRPDGSILSLAGYDAGTGMLFVESEPFPAIPETPDRNRGRAALDYLLDEVLSGFSFAAPNDRAAALSAILTALVRPSLRTAPMHVFSAPQKGSGKTLLANCVALVATGREATAMVFTADPEEQRKRLMSVLMSGDQVLCLDNLEGVLAGDALCAALTSDSISDRLLGTQRQGTAPTCVTWLATGNNLSVGGDMTRRVVYCTIDPRCERPEEREFSRNLSEWIPAHRPALVVAGLTALRAYIAAGRPAQPTLNFGSFEGWHGLVRAALVWLGEADPLASRGDIEDADPVRRKLHDLLLVWWNTFRTAPATTHELTLLANATHVNDKGDTVPENPLLRETLTAHFSDRRGDLSAKAVGDFLSRHERRTVCGARFDPAGFYGARKRWGVHVVDQPLLDDEMRKFLNLSDQPS
ncbi:MAG: bifunctional DNA primase/polymerase [Candidatus Contendobacter sp.]|nr:bifunctional DNA primase/polymerase [Candidatus Contendobacter sp.]